MKRSSYMIYYIKKLSPKQIFDRHLRRALVQDKTKFLFLLILGIFAYFMFISQFFLDNHAFRMPWLADGEQVQNGRWMGPAIGWITYGANVPVVMPVLSIVLCIISAFIAGYTYQSHHHALALTALCAIVLVAPINLAFYYYGFMSPIFFTANLIAATAALILSRLSLVRVLFGAMLVVFMLATYQAALGVLAVLVLTGVVWRSCAAAAGTDKPVSAELARAPANRSYYEEPRSIFAIWAPAGGGIVAASAGLAVYYMTIQYLPDNGKAIDITDMAALTARIREVSIAAFRHIVITQPDILGSLNAALGILLVSGVVATLWRARKSAASLVSVLVAWPLAILGTKAIFFITDPGGVYQYRYNAGLIYLYAFSGYALLSFSRRGIFYLVSCALLAFVVIVSVQADLVRQHVLFRGQERDLSTFNRILYRIESLPEYDASASYDIVRIGSLPRYRLRLLGSNGRQWDEIGDGHMDYGEISDLWVDHHVFGLLGATIRIGPGPKQTAAQIRGEGLLEGRRPWPAESSVFIDNGRIIIYVS